MKTKFAAIGLVLCMTIGYAQAYDVKRQMGRVAGDVVDSLSVQQVQAAGSLEVGFSPKGGAEALVVKVIDSAKADLKVMAYPRHGVPDCLQEGRARLCGCACVHKLIPFRSGIHQHRSSLFLQAGRVG